MTMDAISDGWFWNFYTRFDSIFWKKISISNYEQFLLSIKDLSDASAQWLVRLARLRDLYYFSISVIHTRASLQSNMAA